MVFPTRPTQVATLLTACSSLVCTLDAGATDSPGSSKTEPEATPDDSLLTRYVNVTNTVFFRPLTAGRSMDAEVVDVTGDGRPDILIAGEFGVNTLLAATDDEEAEERYDAVRHAFGKAVRDSEDIAVADFNSDGYADVVFATEDDRQDELFIGSDNGFVDESKRLTPNVESNAVLATDLDGDGHTDLILGGRGPTAVLMNKGDATFEIVKNRVLPDARVTQDLELGDVDGDGDQDLIIANEDGNQLLINDGSGVFSDESAERLPLDGVNEETREADFADVDGDGDLDLFFANVGWNTQKNAANRLLINDGTGRFADESDERLPQSRSLTTLDADFADLDSDGDQDLILGNVNEAPVQIWENTGAGVFIDRTAALIPTIFMLAVIDIEVADLTGDGRPDIYLCNHQGADVVLSPQERR